MKNLKIWSLALALLVAVTGCKPADNSGEAVPFNPIATNLLQQTLAAENTVWQLVEYAGQPAQFDIYIDFDETDYVLYQRLYSSDYEKITGTYTLENGSLTGMYGKDVEWNNEYTAQIAMNPTRLRLIEENGTYAEYIAVNAVPAHIQEQAKETTVTRASVYFL